MKNKKAQPLIKMTNGCIIYYMLEVTARAEVAIRRPYLFAEFNPKTGNTRQCMDSDHHSGSVIRVHPKSING